MAVGQLLITVLSEVAPWGHLEPGRFLQRRAVLAREAPVGGHASPVSFDNPQPDPKGSLPFRSCRFESLHLFQVVCKGSAWYTTRQVWTTGPAPFSQPAPPMGDPVQTRIGLTRRP